MPAVVTRDVPWLISTRREHFQSYPEMGNANFKCTLWTFKPQLAFKMRARCGFSIVLLNVFVLWLSGYVVFELQWRMQDFPEGDTNLRETLTYCLAEFWMKTAWKWKKLDWGARPLPPRPPHPSMWTIPKLYPIAPQKLLNFIDALSTKWLKIFPYEYRHPVTFLFLTSQQKKLIWRISKTKGQKPGPLK